MNAVSKRRAPLSSRGRATLATAAALCAAALTGGCHAATIADSAGDAPRAARSSAAAAAAGPVGTGVQLLRDPAATSDKRRL